MRTMRTSFVLLFLLLSQGAFAAKAPPSRKLVYEDEFVWYLAERLTNELQRLQERTGVFVGMDEGTKQGIRDQYAILYHRYLVQCDGPLPEVAKAYEGYDILKGENVTTISVLTITAGGERTYWPILQQWSNRIRPQLLDTAASGRYGFFPECIIEPFQAQNPKIMQDIKATQVAKPRN